MYGDWENNWLLNTAGLSYCPCNISGLGMTVKIPSLFLTFCYIISVIILIFQQSIKVLFFLFLVLMQRWNEDQ